MNRPPAHPPLDQAYCFAQAQIDAGMPAARIINDMVKTYGIGLTLCYMLKYGFDGRDIPVAQESYEAHAENFFHRTITVGGTVNVHVVLDPGKPRCW